MSTKDRNKAFNKERRAQLKRLAHTDKATVAEVKRLLTEANKQVATILAGSPTEFQSWQLPNLQQSINQVLAEIGNDLAAVSADGASTTWSIGQDLIDKPLEAGGIRLSAVLPDVDKRQLMAMRSFLTDRMKDVTAEIARKVNTQIGLVMIGSGTPADAATQIESVIGGGRGRAITTVRTEMGRAFSMATQERQAQAAEVLPGLKKQWRRSGKIHSRVSHDVADGQIVDVDKPFLVGGVELMYPRDPSGPAKETVNCGCVSIPIMTDWSVQQEGRQPFSEEELRASPTKRNLKAS